MNAVDQRRRELATRDTSERLRNAAAAGFWRRYLAYSIDWLLLAAPLTLLVLPSLRVAWDEARAMVAVLQDWMLGQMVAGATAFPSPLSLLPVLLHDAPLLAKVDAAMTRMNWAFGQAVLLGGGIAAIYFIGFEASSWQATPGKRAVDIAVVDMAGARIGWARAAARFFAGTLSWLTLNLGHALAGWRSDGRALHDLLAGTRVVARSPMPRWARWLLYAQLILLLAAFAGVFARIFWLLAQLAAAGGM